MGHVDRVPYPAKRNDFDSAKFEGNVMRQKVSARISALVAYIEASSSTLLNQSIDEIDCSQRGRRTFSELHFILTTMLIFMAELVGDPVRHQLHGYSPFRDETMKKREDMTHVFEDTYCCLHVV